MTHPRLRVAVDVASWMGLPPRRTVGKGILLLVFLLGLGEKSTLRTRVDGPPFETNLEAGLSTAGETNKPVVVVFVATWCPVCTELKREVLSDPAILAYGDDFIWVSIDIDRKLTTAREYGVDGVPLVMFLDSRGIEQGSITGLVQAPELESILIDLGESQTVALSLGDEEGPAWPRPRSGLTFTPKGYRSEATCFSHVGYGPLAIYSQSPFQALRLSMRPRTPSTLGRGQLELSGWATWVNVWAVEEEVSSTENEFFLDYEMLQTVVALAYGISDTIEIEGEFQNRSRFGGIMDGLTQGFHDLFGIDQSGRDEVDKGLVTLDLAPSDGRAVVSLDENDRGTFSRTLQVSLQHNVTCGTRGLPAIAYSVTARRESVDVDDFNNGSAWDLGASFAVARRFGRFYAYGTFGYSWFGRDDFRGLEMNDTQWTVLLAAESRFFARQSLLLQLLTTEGLVDGFGPFSDNSNELTVGYKWELRSRGILEVGLIENIVSFDNSPDFGIHVGYSQRF
jgi:thioredoxin-related protein